ncbi:RNA polymerase recycling motor HelD [Bacillus rubiinfantis]|uniref:RNA polymerase recycling motor HelD n=1 Tax=Bacillus rubiinfantis TaxID=1499680 RepID=UPI0005A82E78|nr:RNA polymerase recycling motor HelD [Bacillus rubiinfantis]
MADIQTNDWKAEQERVDAVVNEIETKMELLHSNSGKVSGDVLELRKTFWENVTVNLDEPDDITETAASIKQQAELLSERERTQRQVHQQLQILSRLKYSPYFGRIDFMEAGEEVGESVYIGIASFMDQYDENFLIYDWRAPISSLYYDYSPGPAQYPTPEGLIQGEMQLKRQFIIRNANIQGMFDTGITIGDEMLQEVLGNNANTQMKSIVATIQQEQNAIIRNEKSGIIIVQGVAGSGKTSAALQRVAYLLYRYRGTINSENILLFSPNSLFNSYVATVLPELGEENMKQSTFQEYLQQRIGKKIDVEDPFLQMEYLLNGTDESQYVSRLRAIRFKASLEFKAIIDHYGEVLGKKGLLFADFLFRRDVLISKKEIHDYFYSLDQSLSIPNRIQQVKEWLLRELKRMMKRERTRSWVEEEMQYLEKEDFVKAYAELQKQQTGSTDTFDDFDREQKILAEMVVKEKFKPLFKKVKTFNFIDLPQIYLQLFSEPIISQEYLPDDWQEICSITREKLNKTFIPYEDATPYVYLRDLLEGRNTSTAIRHIFMDEAQDYTPFQFAYIRKLFPYSKMTLLGDFNQAIYAGVTNAETVLTNLEIDNEEITTYNLTRTYRSTREIVEFTKAILARGNQIEPFNREGEKPTIILTSRDEIKNNLVQKTSELQAKGYQTIAIICRTAAESNHAFQELKTELSVHLIEKGTIVFEKGIIIIPSYLAKGIEFDAVILYDISQYQREGERKLLYTVCTRAMHELHMTATAGISRLMNNIPEDTYYLKTNG